MSKINLDKIEKGDTVNWNGGRFKVAEIVDYPHGKMVGVYDEDNTNHIDYLNPSDLSVIRDCNSCQGGGCPVCSGYGEIEVKIKK